MAETMQNNLKGQLTILKSQAEEAAISLGTELMPVAKDLVGAASDAVKWFGSLDSGTKRLIVNAGLAAAAMGPTATVLGKVTSGVGGLIDTVGTATTAFQAVKAGTMGFGAALTSVISPAGLVVLGLAAVTAAGVALYMATKDARKGTEALGDAMSGAADYAKDFASEIHGASGRIDEFSSDLNGGFDMSDLKSKIADVQDKITDITSKASAERRKLTKEEIKQLQEYYDELRKLTDQEFQYYSNNLDNLQSVIDSGITMTEDTSKKILSEASSYKQEGIKL